MDENKSQPLHVTGILLYRIQRQVEFLLFNDTFSHKKHWTAPKGKVIGQEDELKCALRNAIELTNLSVKDIRIEDNFKAEITYLSGTRPKRVVYYLAHVSDHARVFTTGEGINFAWLPHQQASERALYRSMQDIIKQAYAFIESHKPARNAERARPANNDRLESRMKNLNLALPLESQRQAMSRQRLELQREQRRSEKSSNGFSSPLQSPVMQFENPLYKTRLCERFETEGFCPYGPKCTFAHGTAELRERPVSEDKVGAPPTAKDGPENPLYKTRLCERFMKENFCQYGPKCNFAHGEDELRERPVLHHSHRETRDGDCERKSHGHHNNKENGLNGPSRQPPMDSRHAPTTPHHGPSRQPSMDSRPTFSPSEHHSHNQTQLASHQSQQQQQQLPPSPPSPKHIQHQAAPENRLFRGNGTGDVEKKVPSVNLTTFPRSEIQNGILSRINTLTPSGDTARPSPFANRDCAQSQQSTTRASSNDSAHRFESTEARNSNDDTKRQNGKEHCESTGARETDLDNNEHKEQKDQRDLSPAQATQSLKSTTNRRRPIVNDTVSLKDFLKSGKKNEKEKSWIEVVEFSNDELYKHGNIKKHDSPTTNGDKRSHEDVLVAELKRMFTRSIEQERSASDDVKDVTRFEIRHDLSKQQLYNVLILSLYEDASWDAVSADLSKREQLFKKFIRSPQDQVTFLRSWEKFLLERKRSILSKAAHLFKTFYDRDYVEEDSVYNWYNQAQSSGEVKKKCEVFVDWLKNAEEED